jgi:DNA-directed RNA polymerase specialized sigma24 family protein
MDASSALSIAGTLWLLTAATFAAAYEGWARLDPERPLRPWLYGIAANLVRHHWRHERRMLRAYARTGADPVKRRETPNSTGAVTRR